MIERPMRALARGVAVALALGAGGGLARAASSHVSGSVYIDDWVIPDSNVAAQAPRGITPEGSLKVTAIVTEDVSFSAKACFSCHGIEMEHLMVEYAPKGWFNVQAGRVAVPFGEYANRVDPSGHTAPSAPLIYDMGRMIYGSRNTLNLGVVPQPYIDTGVILFGVFFLGDAVQVWYGGYGVAGMRGGNDVDFVAMRALYYTDNNGVPSYGGRVAINVTTGPHSFLGDLSVGGSYTGGRYNAAARLSYYAWGADASLKLGPLTFRGEYADRRTDIDTSVPGYGYVIVDPWVEKTGWYAELEHPLGKRITAIYRVDRLQRQGVPLPGANAALTPDSRLDRLTVGLQFVPADALFIKGDWEYWRASDFPDANTFHVGIGGAF
jgi:hypothetical protein